MQILLDLHLPRLLKYAVDREFPGKYQVSIEGGIYQVKGSKPSVTILSLYQDPRDEYILLLEQGKEGIADYNTVHRLASCMKGHLEELLDHHIKTEIFAYI